MQLDKIELQAIGSEGLEVTVEDRSIWLEPIRRYGLRCRIIDQLTATVTIITSEDGCLVRGRIKGTVSMPCIRCMEETQVSIDQSFDEFEEYPSEERSEESGEDSSLETEVLRSEAGVMYLDLSSLLWEEFSLALPVKPLCRPACKGLCPECGANLNEGPCNCSRDSGDPRLAVLRQLKLKR